MTVFFFFQAEDGIRDLYVTGVQTCALPSSNASSSRQDPRWNCRSTRRWQLSALARAGSGLLLRAPSGNGRRVMTSATDQLREVELRHPVVDAPRRDRWWIAPLATVFVLVAFVVYGLWVTLSNDNYYARPYLSPFYSP